MKSKAIVVLLGLVLSGALAAQTPSGGPIAELERRIQELEQQLAALEPGALGTALQITDVNGKVFGPVLGQTDTTTSEVLLGDKVWRLQVTSDEVFSRGRLQLYYVFQDPNCSGAKLIDSSAFYGTNEPGDIWEDWLPEERESVYDPQTGWTTISIFMVPKAGASPRTVQIRSYRNFSECVNDTQMREAYFEDDLEVVNPTEDFELPFSIPVQSR